MQDSKTRVAAFAFGKPRVHIWRGAGLDHVAFNIGTSLDELREARTKLEAAGVSTTPIDHEVTKSLYFQDPDGNGIEVYVDASQAWRSEPQRVAQIGRAHV